MSLFSIIGILLTITALFSYLNNRYFRLPSAIGLMLIALIMSVAIMISDDLGFDFVVQARDMLNSMNFSQAVLDGMLSFMLLAGALHTNFVDLKKEKWVVGLLATAGVILSAVLGTSGPIAIVAAGLVVGSQRRKLRKNLDQPGTIESFWEIVDGILNAVLFVWIGLYLLILPLEIHEVVAGAFAILVVLAGRFVSVSAILQFFAAHRRMQPRIRRILTWGGVRGGISIALALSIQHSGASEIIVSMTYIVVAFSILVQGLTFKKLVSV